MSPSHARTVRTPGPEPRRRIRAASGLLVLDRYRLHRRLGAGAFGTVWLARDERLEREVAVKILPRERGLGGRFEREARAAARLAHPGIVTLYEAAVDDEGAYLVSELVRGVTLDELLADGRLSDQDILTIGIALCDALGHAHDEGVVHRDVKPSNILVPARPASPTQVAKLTDFGVARVVGGDSLTRTGEVIGTLAYMAPEQAEGLHAGASADVYSLALVIYEALTGVNPIRAVNLTQRSRRLGVHLPPLRRQRRDLPRELGTGIDHALRPRPGERGRMADLRRALVQARPQVSDVPGVVAPPRLPGTRAPATDGSETRLDADPLTPRAGSGSSPAADQRPGGDPALRATPAPRAWPARGLAATASAGLAAWICVRLLAPAPLAPALAALAAGGLTLLLPRIGWLALSVTAGGAAAAQGHPGTALVLLTAALVAMLLQPRRPTAWPLSAAAPGLGLIGLAGAWPALAGRAATPWRRAALGFTGWVWLLLASALAGRGLYLSASPGIAPSSVWTASGPDALDQVMGALVRSGALAPGAVWALAAALVPGLVRGRSLGLDLARTALWAAALVFGTAAAAAAAVAPHPLSLASSALAGGLAAAVLALAPRAVHAGRAKARRAGFEAEVP